MPTLPKFLAVIAFASVVPACGRTPMELTECMIQVEQKSLDFGDVVPGESAKRQVRLMNVGGQSCQLKNPAFASGSDGWFSLEGNDYPIQLAPQEMLPLLLTFEPQAATLPLTRTGIFLLDIGGPNRGQIQIPITGRVKSDCQLTIAPRTIEFGTVQVGNTATQIVRVENVGKGPCEIRGVQLEKDGDPQFKLSERGPGIEGLGQKQVASIQVAFAPTDYGLPRERVSSLLFSTSDEANAFVKIPLRANIDIGCELSFTPVSVDFGKVTLNKTATATVSLKNTGTSDCGPTNFAFTKESHPDFELDRSRPLPTRIPPNGTDTLALIFTAADVSLPRLKTATFVFLTSDKRKPEARIPLSATVDTFCKDESKWIYTVDLNNNNNNNSNNNSNSTLSKFDPSTKTFTTIAELNCATSSTPNSMAVDQNAVAWVAYNDGNLFKVDTATGKCEPTSFVRDQDDMHVFGMGFMFDPATNTDTLYIAGGSEISNSTNTPSPQLATISFPKLTVDLVGRVENTMIELSGTGDGALWGAFPTQNSVKGTKGATLIRLDPRTGATLETYAYENLTYPSNSGSETWAMKFWGGSFWIFLNRTIYEVKRDDLKNINLVIDDSGHQVVGAGVSSCAPLKK